jgi:hypothetical protein
MQSRQASRRAGPSSMRSTPSLAEIGDKTASECLRVVGLITYRGSPFLEAKPSRPRR